MAINEEDVLHMRSRLKEAVGMRATDTLMEYLPPDGWAGVARHEHVQNAVRELKGDLADVRGEITVEIAGVRLDMANLRTELKDDIAGVRNDMANLRTDVKEDMANLRTELKDDIAGVKNDMANLRADVKEDMARITTLIAEQRERHAEDTARLVERQAHDHAAVLQAIDLLRVEMARSFHRQAMWLAGFMSTLTAALVVALVR